MKQIENSTATQYKFLLHKLNIDELDLTDFNNIFYEIQNITDNLGTQKTYLSAIIWHIRSLNINVELYEYTKKIAELSTIISQERENNTNNYKEAERFIEWNDLIQLKNKVQQINFDLNYKKKSVSKFALLLAIYTELPPRRVADYANMIYVTDLAQIHNLTNYFVNLPDKSYFMFNQYKTCKKYGRQDILIPIDLLEKIKLYILLHQIQSGDNLFKLSCQGLSKFMAKYLLKYSNKNATVNTIRHSYATFLENKQQNDKLSVKQRKLIANQMGHGLLENLLYSKHK